MQPTTHYAKSGDIHVAYQVFGEGSINAVLAPFFVSQQAALISISEGGPLSALFAATYPERCSALLLCGSFARFSSWFPTEESLAQFLDYIDQGFPAAAP